MIKVGFFIMTARPNSRPLEHKKTWLRRSNRSILMWKCCHSLPFAKDAIYVLSLPHHAFVGDNKHLVFLCFLQVRLSMKNCLSLTNAERSCPSCEEVTRSSLPSPLCLRTLPPGRSTGIQTCLPAERTSHKAWLFCHFRVQISRVKVIAQGSMWITSGSFRWCIFASHWGHLVQRISWYGLRKKRYCGGCFPNWGMAGCFFFVVIR